MGQPFHIKICGITTREDASDAVAAGATALGFNFHPPSPRFVTAARAAEIAADLPAHITKVGVFVNLAAPAVLTTMREALLDVAQLHGDEVPDEALSGIRVWKAFRVNAEFDARVLDAWTVEAILLDSPAGGSGQTFDWRHATGLGRRIVLAGGLDASNVAEAIRLVRPWGVDSCSRLELAPGRKDAARVRAFVQQSLQAKQLLETK